MKVKDRSDLSDSSFIPHPSSFRWDVVIIGGGAAGLFCAAEAVRRGRRTLILEHAARVGQKIAISGGGRCNFTNLGTTSENFISANPNFCKSALARYTPADFVALVERHRVRYHEKKLGQLFCDGSSRQIIEMLLIECDGATVVTDCAVRAVRRQAEEGGFAVDTVAGEFFCESLVVATGGLSIPQLGATDFGYRVARQFGLRVEETRPALVPFTLHRRELDRMQTLSGVSLDATVRTDATARADDRDGRSARVAAAEFRENILVTHRGLSGPAVLQISSYWRAGEKVTIDLLPGLDARQELAEKSRGEIELANWLGQFLPKRFAHAWCELYAPSRPLNTYTRRELEAAAHLAHNWPIEPAGTEGYRKAEVTAGGVSTDELSSKTMEARRAPGLYFIGEVVDVTGHLGGYNFQWAWASAHAAGQCV